jgi:phage terminase large subunit
LMNALDDFTITKDEIVNRKSGSKIIFRGIKTSSGDQTANLKSIQGLSTWVLDEAEELKDEDKFDTINLSVRQKGVQNRVILIMNPTTKEHWVYQKFFEGRGVQEGANETREDVNYIHTTYLDNLDNLSQSYIDDLERMKARNPKKYQHKILGGWLDKAEGVVFENWNFGTFNPDGLQTSFGLDFGFSVDPDALTEVAIDKAKKKIYLKEHIYENGLQTHVLATKLKRCAGDKLIIADSAEPRLISDLKHKGINIKPVSKGKIESRVVMMQDFELVVEPNSTNIAKELNNYIYSDKRSNLYVDDYNHALDGIGYNIVYHLDNPNKGNYSLK